MPTAANPTNAPAPTPTHTESVKDTLISIVIAFTLAFVFRGFVVEAFVIPTGSMAPTLMGAHMQFRGPSTGYSWPVGPWDGHGQPPYAATQTGPHGEAVVVHDPISGEEVIQTGVPLRSGDRILVLKYLYALMEPSRFDVVVFKNPHSDPSQNYIKRLIGLPGEEIALVDGDVFTRPASHAPDEPGKGLWEQPGWRIARKGHTEQMAVWQTVYDSAFAPPDGSGVSRPWSADNPAAWDFGPNVYTCKADGRTELFFDHTKRRFAGRAPYSRDDYGTWAIDDRYAYDEGPMGGFQQGSAQFPVSDVRLRLGIEPTGDHAPRVEALVRARGMDFRASIDGATATLEWREQAGEAGVLGKWQTLATAAVAPLSKGRVTDVEFWHSDQSLRLFVDGALVARHDYDWSPARRFFGATGRELRQVLADNPRAANPLADPRLYREPDVRWTFSGAPFRLYRVGIDRDLHYQPRAMPSEPVAALATSPTAPLVLSGDEFFCCGDNSPQSLDGRLWGKPEPWVAYEFGPDPGVVPRDLMLGKAFFVYWPAPHWHTVPIPDFGKMRFIR